MADIISVGNKQDKWTIRVTELLNWLNDNKQAVLTAGNNITLTPLQDGTVRIDASGGSGGSSTLADLTDVNLSNPSNNQVLVYDATNQEWVNANQSGGGNYHCYSTTEQVIGEWIDGKPLYEVTIPFQHDNSWDGARTVINHGIADIETPVNIIGRAYNSASNALFPISIRTPSDAYTGDRNINSGLVIEFNSFGISNFALILGVGFIQNQITIDLVVTFQYTKTTDV